VNNFFKRGFDFITSTIGFLLISPILLIIAVLIKITSKGPILFKQKRVGKNALVFNILKFRTMVVDAEKVGRQITVGNDSRITKVGIFLRKYKLDELPQLINVIKGDMSLVGPRPEVPKYVELYNENQKRVLEVRPGITDYASIEYRDENSILGNVENPEEYYINIIMPHKIDLNMKYIENNNVFIDIAIIFKTIFNIGK
jgi:lipopolysaccharide/colanic/teichoic acid biosynthesis glycosyltransferase